jgi:hypothetical protein
MISPLAEGVVARAVSQSAGLVYFPTRHIRHGGTVNKPRRLPVRASVIILRRCGRCRPPLRSLAPARIWSTLEWTEKALERRGECDRARARPCVHRVGDRPPRSSRNSQLLANVQSRETVSVETSSASAVSSTLRPVKKRNSTTRHLRGSNASSASSASSSAMTSGAVPAGSRSASSDTRMTPPPRLATRRARAASTRIWRINRLHIAKK